jgi:hypothetical protein
LSKNYEFFGSLLVVDDQHSFVAIITKQGISKEMATQFGHTSEYLVGHGGVMQCLDDDGQKIMPSTFQLYLNIYYRKSKCFIRENPILNIIPLFGSKYSHIEHALPKDLNEEILISNELEYFVNSFMNGCSHVNKSDCCPLR